MTKKQNQKTTRMTLDLTEEFQDRLEALRAKAGKTKAGVLRDALQLYEFVVNKTAEGYTFSVADEKGKSQQLAIFR